MQPGSKTAIAPERMQFLPGPDERFLQQVFRQGRIASAQTPGQTKYVVPVPPVQFFEGSTITFPGEFHQSGIVIVICGLRFPRCH